MDSDEYGSLMDESGDDSPEAIDYDVVTMLAKCGLKNPVMIAHKMNLPVEWFTDVHKEKVDLAIERGLADLVLETTGQIRKNAQQGDFNAQKYVLQNVDPTWTDKREVVNKNEVDITTLPLMYDLFRKGLELQKEKEVNVIEGESEAIEPDDSTRSI